QAGDAIRHGGQISRPTRARRRSTEHGRPSRNHSPQPPPCPTRRRQARQNNPTQIFARHHRREESVTLYYQDDHVTLYHGDCLTEHREWLEADVLLTDPPYGVKWTQRIGGYAGAGSYKTLRMAVSGDADEGLRDAERAAWGAGPGGAVGSG